MVEVCFFYGTTIPALLVRIRTRRWGQRFAEVPAHVGIIAGTHPAYFEAIVSGVHCDSPIPFNVQPVMVAVPNEAALVSYLRDQVGDCYDWHAIIDDTVGQNLPWATLVNSHRTRAHDCSGLVLDALLVGGVHIEPDSLPETPNDLLLALRDLVGISTHQTHENPERKTLVDFFKAIGRMFTVPRKVRTQLDANPVVQGAKAVLLPSLIASLAATVDSNISDPTAAALVKAELSSLIQSSGIAN